LQLAERRRQSGEIDPVQGGTNIEIARREIGAVQAGPGRAEDDKPDPVPVERGDEFPNLRRLSFWQNHVSFARHYHFRTAYGT
jgi:hypothetical protein